MRAFVRAPTTENADDNDHARSDAAPRSVLMSSLSGVSEGSDRATSDAVERAGPPLPPPPQHRSHDVHLGPSRLQAATFLDQSQLATVIRGAVRPGVRASLPLNDLLGDGEGDGSESSWSGAGSDQGLLALQEGADDGAAAGATAGAGAGAVSVSVSTITQPGMDSMAVTAAAALAIRRSEELQLAGDTPAAVAEVETALRALKVRAHTIPRAHMGTWACVFLLVSSFSRCDVCVG
jgi:hypothetical protein